MSNEQVIELLEDYRQALEAGDYEAAETAVNELMDVYDGVRDDEQKLEQQLKSVRERSAVEPEERERIERYLQSKVATELKRNALLSGSVSVLVGDGDFGDPSSLVESTEQLKDREQTLQSDTQAAEESIESKDIPPNVSISNTVGPETVGQGSDFDITVTVENVGDQTAESVEVNVIPDAGISSNRGSKQFGEIPASSDSSISFGMRAEGEGVQEITFELSSENAGEDTNVLDVLVEATDTSGSQWYTDYTNDDDVVETDGLNKAVADYLGGDLGPSKLNAVISSYLSGNPINA